MHELQRLIKNGESETVEFKESLSLKSEIGETVSAFSNTNKGKIIIGISDSGKIIGVEVGKKTLEELANYIKQNTDNHIYPKMKLVKSIDDKNLIIIEVNEANEKPVFFRGNAYRRISRSNHKLSASEIRKLAKESGKKVYWDEQVCEGAGLDDIDKSKLRWFLKIAKAKRGLAIEEKSSSKDILAQLNLLKDGKLTNASILLFGKDCELLFMQCEVKCIALPAGEFVKPYNIYQAYNANLFELVDKTVAFILENVQRPLWIDPGEISAKHPYEIPGEAVREAIVNAIVHRDYNSPSKVQVRVFPDRVEIWNPGQLPQEIKINNLNKPHPSMPHNPLLFRQFYRAAYVEDVGGGTIDIIQKCRDAHLPEPKFEEKMGCFIATIWRSTLTEDNLNALGLNETQRKAINYLKKHTRITRAEYEKISLVSERTANRELTDLVNRKLIEKKGKGPETFYSLARFGEIWRDNKSSQ